MRLLDVCGVRFLFLFFLFLSLSLPLPPPSLHRALSTERCAAKEQPRRVVAVRVLLPRDIRQRSCATVGVLAAVPYRQRAAARAPPRPYDSVSLWTREREREENASPGVSSFRLPRAKSPVDPRSCFQSRSRASRTCERQARTLRHQCIFYKASIIRRRC